MTIVDSINKITESLGGDTSGVQTAAEAIDALNPVLTGGGSGSGVGLPTSRILINYSDTSIYDQDSGETNHEETYTVESVGMDELMSLDEFIALRPNIEGLEYATWLNVEDVYVDLERTDSYLSDNGGAIEIELTSIARYYGKVIGKHSIQDNTNGGYDAHADYIEIIVFPYSQTGATSPYYTFTIAQRLIAIYRHHYKNDPEYGDMAGKWDDWQVIDNFSYSNG